MRLAYLLTVTIHVLAAMFWLGGMFFLGLVGAPVLRTVEPAPLRQRLFSELDFALGPAASRAEAGSEAALAARRRAAWLARVNALVGVILLIAAVRLARG